MYFIVHLHKLGWANLSSGTLMFIPHRIPVQTRQFCLSCVGQQPKPAHQTPGWISWAVRIMATPPSIHFSTWTTRQLSSMVVKCRLSFSTVKCMWRLLRIAIRETSCLLLVSYVHQRSHLVWVDTKHLPQAWCCVGILAGPCWGARQRARTCVGFEGASSENNQGEQRRHRNMLLVKQ